MQSPRRPGYLQTWQQPGEAPVGRVSKYPEQFRRQAAAMVLDGVGDVARGLDVNHETLRNWVAAMRAARAAPGGPVSVDERNELARLRRRVADLELEKVILSVLLDPAMPRCAHLLMTARSPWSPGGFPMASVAIRPLMQVISASAQLPRSRGRQPL